MKDKNGKDIRAGQIVSITRTLAPATEDKPAVTSAEKGFVVEVAENAPILKADGTTERVDLAQVAVSSLVRPAGAHFVHETVGVANSRNWLYTELREATSEAIESL